MVPFDATAQQQVVNIAAECGLAADAFKVDVDGGGDIYLIVKSRDLSDNKLSCLVTRERREPYPIVIFEREQLTRRYVKIQNNVGREESRRWLQRRGMLSSLPEFDPSSENLDQFARRMENYCGFQAGVVLRAISPNLLSTQKSWSERALAGQATATDEQKFECLLKAIWASNLGDHKIGFGFIGNEALAKPSKP